MEGEIQSKKYFGFQVKCPSLLTDFNLTCDVPSAYAQSARYDVSVTSLLWKARYSRKSTLVFK
jgi:hypothetical protein